jgi:hypothetical protein
MKTFTAFILAASVFIIASCGKTDIEPDMVVVEGQPGRDGVDGRDGSDGAAGAGCEVSEILPSLLAPAGGALISCGPNTVIVYNGVNGEDGEDATLPPTSIVEVIDPCGDAPGIFDEVLLKLENDQILASFSQNQSGLNTRFSLLTPGTYGTTDGTSCVFTVNSDMSVSW